MIFVFLSSFLHKKFCTELGLILVMSYPCFIINFTLIKETLSMIFHIFSVLFLRFWWKGCLCPNYWIICTCFPQSFHILFLQFVFVLFLLLFINQSVQQNNFIFKNYSHYCLNIKTLVYSLLLSEWKSSTVDTPLYWG